MYWLRQAVLISFKDTTQWRRDIWGFVLTLGFPMAFATAFFFFLTPVFEEVAQDSGPSDSYDHNSGNVENGP